MNLNDTVLGLVVFLLVKEIFALIRWIITSSNGRKNGSNNGYAYKVYDTAVDNLRALIDILINNQNDIRRSISGQDIKLGEIAKDIDFIKTKVVENGGLIQSVHSHIKNR